MNIIHLMKNIIRKKLEVFTKTRAEYLQKPDIVLTVEEAHQKIRNKHRDGI